MPVYKRAESPYWQIRFELAGVEVKKSSGTTDKRAAEDLEEQLRRDLWRQIKLGEQRFIWDDAVKKYTLEHQHEKGWERTQRSIDILNEYFEGEDLLEITYDALLSTRGLLEQRISKGNGWKTVRTWERSTCNRVLAVVAAVLNRCTSEDWKVNGKKMLETAPSVPLFVIPKKPKKWITREKAHSLLGRFPLHTRDMTIFGLATGLRKANVAGLKWECVDMIRCVAWVEGYETKAGEPIPVPLNEDAMAVLRRWKRIHEERAHRWKIAVRAYVFVYDGRRHSGIAPIQQITTKMWRRECAAVGLPGVTFHTMRHTWASWHTQAGTPLRQLQELGGWASIQMPQDYGHLAPGHLAQYADRTLLGPESVSLEETGAEALVSDCSGGKGGTRTLDPGIMRTVLKKKAG